MLAASFRHGKKTKTRYKKKKGGRNKPQDNEKVKQDSIRDCKDLLFIMKKVHDTLTNCKSPTTLTSELLLETESLRVQGEKAVKLASGDKTDWKSRIQAFLDQYSDWQYDASPFM